jgi:hypothetical protein
VDGEVLVQVVAIATSFGVGLPTLARSLARRDRPGILLALSVVLDGVEWSFWAACIHTPAYGTPLGDALAVACRVGISASVLCLLLFTREVFRPRSRAAGAFVALLALGMLAGLVGSGMLGDWGGFQDDNAWVWIENVSQLAAFAWGFAEPVAYHAKLRRRVRIGLADPLVAHRMLLWGAYSGSFAICQLVWMLVLVAFDDLTALDGLMVSATVAGELSLWLAFFPPSPYARWIRRERPSAA